MAGRRIRPMTAADLARPSDPCPRCPSEDQEAVRTWARAVTDRWGSCGVMAVDDGRVVAWLTLTPPDLAPPRMIESGAATSPDAAVVATIRVAEELRGRGLGRQLVQSAAGLVARRDLRALEVLGRRASDPGCLAPTAFWEAVGFAVVRPHPRTPRLRLDLSSTARWRPDLAGAWTRLTDLVAQPAAPAPGGVGFRTPTPTA